MNSWHKRFLELAYQISLWSKDTSTKVGCIIVKDKRILSTGYNGLARNLNDDPSVNPERHDRTLNKYSFYIHAENNAIYNAARAGISLEKGTAYITLAPCIPCASALIQSGIKLVVYDKEATDAYIKKGRLDVSESIAVLLEAGVDVKVF